MSLKVNFLNAHLDYFPENLGAVSEEQRKTFHQDIKEMETRYQGRWNANMMEDYCWLLHRDDPQATYKRKKIPNEALKEKGKGTTRTLVQSKCK
jgi:hypothetical protein